MMKWWSKQHKKATKSQQSHDLWFVLHCAATALRRDDVCTGSYRAQAWFQLEQSECRLAGDGRGGTIMLQRGTERLRPQAHALIIISHVQCKNKVNQNRNDVKLFWSLSETSLMIIRWLKWCFASSWTALLLNTARLKALKTCKESNFKQGDSCSESLKSFHKDLWLKF